MKPIYEPKGKAKEYGDYALNIYTGCPHRCYYCYAANRLAAYEDTGYTPEEVAQMGAALKMQALMVQEASAVWNAQQEGRVIVLPCKVGDTVYIHSPSIGSNREIVLPKEISCASEIVKWIENKCFGNTVFLTMAEAVSALKEKYDA